MKRYFSLVMTLLLLLSVLPLGSAAAEDADISEFKIYGINVECRTGQLVVYTESGKPTGTQDGCVEVSVDADGRVLSVGGHNNTVPEGGLIVAGNGNKGKQLESLSAGDGIYVDTEALTVTVISKDYKPFYENTVTVNTVNGTRKQDTIVMFTDSFGAKTNTNAWGFEVVVNKDGFVVEIGGNDSAIPEGGFVLSGHGTGKTALEEAAEIGMSVTVADDKKSATLAFAGQSAVVALQTQTKAFRAYKAQAIARWRLVDEEALALAEQTLDGLCSDMQSAIDNEDYVQYLIIDRTFAKELAKANDLLVEEKPVESRGFWLRPALNTKRDYIFETVESIWKAGFNQVYIEILFDNTTIIKMPEDSLYTQNPALTDSDMLETYIEACHSYGIEIHAWMSVFRVGYKGSKNTNYSIGIKKPEWLNISKNGLDYVENAYGDAFFVNPALPEVREYLLKSYTYIAENYDLDGFQLDYIRYPNKADGEDFGYDDYTVGLYQEQYGKDPRKFTAGTDDYQSWCEFRASFVTQFVRDLKVKLQEIRPDMYLSAAVAPGYEQTLVNMCQDSVTWLKEGLIDIAHPMAYGTTDAVLRYIGETLRAANDNVFTCIGVSDQGGDIFREQILATRADETDGVAFFSWSAYDARYSKIAETIFASHALSPTYNGKAAMLAQLALIRKRIEQQLQDDFPSLASLCGQIDEQCEALENSTLSDRDTDLRALLDSIVSTARDTDNKAAEDVLADDCRIAYKLLNSNRDDAKAAYIAEHPLPDSLIPDGSESETEPSDSTSETDSETESTVSEQSENTELSPVEKVFSVIGMVILFGGLALVPVYIVLMIRRKKIIKSFEQEKTEEDDTQE